MRRTWEQHNRGFTLVEIMIAAAILAVNMAIVYGSFAGSLKTMEISEGDSETWRKSSLILGRMAQEISCAYLPAAHELADISYVFIGQDGEEDGMPRDTLNFVSTALALRGGSKGLKEVGYSVSPDPETGEPTLVVREDATPDDLTDEGGRRYLLGQGIWGLDFAYVDARGREWKRWESNTTVFDGQLPRLVKISLILRDTTGEMFTVTTKTCIPRLGE